MGSDAGTMDKVNTTCSQTDAGLNYRKGGAKGSSLASFNELKPRAVEVVMLADAYAVEEKPRSRLGAAMTVAVWLATIAYTAVIIYQYVNRSPTITNDIDWTSGAGPFPLSIHCAAIDGCYVTNYVGNYSNTPLQPVVEQIPQEQQQCFFLAYRQQTTLQTTYFPNQANGVAVLYNRDKTDPNEPAGTGVLVESEMRCTPSSTMCTDGVSLMKNPVGPGITFFNYVRTDDYTRDDRGRLRHEWFPATASNDGAVRNGTSPCMSVLDRAQLQDMVEVQLKLQSFWNHIVIDMNQSWLDILATFGGAYSLFLELGGLGLLVLVALHTSRRWLNKFRHQHSTRSAHAKDDNDSNQAEAV